MDRSDRTDPAPDEIVRVEEAPLQRSVFDEIIPSDNPTKRYISAAIAIVLAVVSFFVIASWAGSPQTYADIIASLDEKRDNVMRLVTGSTGTAAAITLLPGDVGTPIAEKLLDVGSDFAIVIGALYLEKYMLTILGLAAFRILIPIGCILFAAAAMIRDSVALRQFLFRIGLRLAFFGVAIFLVVPASVAVSNLIEDTYEVTMADALETVEQTAETNAEPEAGSAEGLEGLVQFITQIPENLSNAATGVSEEVQTALNRFIETLAVMIVTSCVIPILVLLFFIWLAKTILGVHVEVPVSAFRPRSMRRLRA